MSNEDVSIVRAPRTKDRPYFSMCRASAQDERLSWEARGVLAYLLSKPDDWQVQIKDLQQGCGRDKVKSILKELLDTKYLTVKQEHDPETGKFLRNHYQTYETPFTENPSTVEPSTANTSLTDKRTKQNTDKKKTRTKSQDEPKALSPRDKALAAFNENPISATLLGLFGNGTPPANLTTASLESYTAAAHDLSLVSATPDKVRLAHQRLTEKAKLGNWTDFGLTAFLKHYPQLINSENKKLLSAGDWQITPAPALPDVGLTLEDRQKMVESTRKQRIGGV